MKPLVKHVVRGLSKTNRALDSGARDVDTLNAEISSYMLEGYELKWVFPLGDAPDLMQFLYVFLLRETEDEIAQFVAMANTKPNEQAMEAVDVEEEPKKRGPGRPKGS